MLWHTPFIIVDILVVSITAIIALAVFPNVEDDTEDNIEYYDSETVAQHLNWYCHVSCRDCGKCFINEHFPEEAERTGCDFRRFQMKDLEKLVEMMSDENLI